ncbi:hypothetical protein HOE37_01600 [Candidatus Woesearchaeota archaeon]|jgi:hypothetical protein|nr:hypothetical protein [Candidatus Woesearchaeota archaeon]MBT4110530.1 hypothetical protein [Candidatus Woesearchaeota archaeon]MBT4335946.1 hypothetical protein [Candidatus Woesearchaeota archaeon]MBT4469075.1 hypothetical protein [Candidatus Woesearchaeota archaeon]MBT6744606.1 hypothetical protein [Candidatus Woesearchaeota archaeon]
MVLEHIFPEDWLERKGIYALILGIVYSFIGLLIASVLFPGDPALVAVAFTSLLLLPELYKIFSIEERQESMEQKVSLQSLWKDDVDVVKIYVYLFIGILLVYSVGTMVMPEMQSNTLFREQLEIRFGQGFAGSAVSTEFFDAGLFKSLLSNNFLVLMACFIMALLTGDGAIFLITWNASVWGTIFGLTAKNAASFSGQWPILIFVGIMFVVFCHMIIEALSYFLAAISGSVISKDVLLEKFASNRFFEVFTFNLYLLLAALITLLIGALVETIVLIMELPIFAFAIIVVILLAVFLITKYFILPFEWRGNHLFNNLFLYFYAFFIALAVMIIFGLPDFGLGTISYQEIIKMSFMASA